MAQIGFGAPFVPARPRGACKHFQIGPLAQPLDAPVSLVRLAAVLAPGGDDQLFEPV
jgi:hypothetical protein